jgi:branched-chain amino acid transport system ATP-binding protein
VSDAGEPLVQVRGLCGGYGSGRVLFDVDLDIPSVGVVAVVGRNGGGKTTLLRTLLGYQKATAGSIVYAGRDIGRTSPSALARLGVGYVPQENVVFPTLSVRDNLRLGLLAVPRAQRQGLDEVLALFPKLAGRLDQQAGTMSGGERKMVGMARALLGRPRLLVMDEPTEGVWHGVVEEMLQRLESFAEQAAVLLVEQNLEFALALALHVVVLERGKVVLSGPAAELRDSPALREHVAL